MSSTLHVVIIVLNAIKGRIPATASVGPSDAAVWKRGWRGKGRMGQGHPPARALFGLAHDHDGNPSPDFLRARIPVLAKYTLRSLAQQTAQDFHILVLYDRRLDIAPFLVDEHMPKPFTPESPIDRLHFVAIDPIDIAHGFDEFWRARPAQDAKIETLARGESRLLLTFIDSDDSYRLDALARFREAAAGHDGAIVMRSGYVHDVKTGTVRGYSPPCPPFYTLAYDMDQYRSGRRYHGGRDCSHTYISTSIPTLFLDDRLFMVNIHNSNDSSSIFISQDRFLAADELAVVAPMFGLEARP